MDYIPNKKLTIAATICVAFVLRHTGWTLQESYDYVFKCRGVIMPNNGFFNQLVRFENVGVPFVDVLVTWSRNCTARHRDVAEPVGSR